jgi:hypothetical protein
MRALVVQTCGLLALCGACWGCGGGVLSERPTARLTAVPRTESFTRAEQQLLETGHVVHRERELTRGDARYLGTVSYELVNARPSTIMAAFSDATALTEILPNTKRASLIEASQEHLRVELVQGNDWAEATYTVYLVREPESSVRFRLDRSRPHDIEDAWGYFRVAPFDGSRTLVTVGVAVDLGSGLFRRLLDGAVQACILTTPDFIKRYSERVETERGLVQSARASNLVSQAGWAAARD